MKKLLLLILLIPSLVFASPYNGGPVSGGGGGGSGGMVYPGLGIPQSTGAAWGVSIVPSADVQTFLGYADFAAMRTGLSLVPGTNVQAYDPDLTIYASITPSANVQTFLGYASFAAMKAGLSIDDAFTAMGIADGVTTLGTFTGSTIADSSTVKTALQALETSLEAGPIYSTQTATCTDSGDGNPGTLTLQPNTGAGRVDIELTVADEHGCTVTMGETGNTENQWVRIVNVSAANTATFTTSAGVLTLKNGTPFVVGSKETLDIKYVNSEWLEQGRATVTMTGGFSILDLPQGTDSAPTDEGRIYHNTSTDATTVGSGAAAQELLKPAVTTITKTEILPIRYAEDDDSVTAAAAVAEIGTTTVIARSFAEDADNGAVFWWYVPRDYVGGIKFLVHYSTDTNAGADETAAFSLSGCAVGNLDALACSEGTAVTVTDELTADYDTEEEIVTDWSSAVTVTDILAGKKAKLLLIRDVSEDDMVGHALVTAIEIKYQAKINASSDY